MINPLISTNNNHQEVVKRDIGKMTINGKTYQVSASLSIGNRETSLTMQQASALAISDQTELQEMIEHLVKSARVPEGATLSAIDQKIIAYNGSQSINFTGIPNAKQAYKMLNNAALTIINDAENERDKNDDIFTSQNSSSLFPKKNNSTGYRRHSNFNQTNSLIQSSKTVRQPFSNSNQNNNNIQPFNTNFNSQINNQNVQPQFSKINSQPLNNNQSNLLTLVNNNKKQSESLNSSKSNKKEKKKSKSKKKKKTEIKKNKQLQNNIFEINTEDLRNVKFHFKEIQDQ